MKFNITGHKDNIAKIVQKHKTTEITTIFGEGDVNIDIHEDFADDLYEMGDELNVKVQYLGD